MLAWFRYFCRKSVSRAEDVHLTQFWSILTKQSRGSGLDMFVLAGHNRNDFQAFHWSTGPGEGFSLADNMANCDRR